MSDLLIPADLEWVVRDYLTERFAAEGWGDLNGDTKLREHQSQTVLFTTGGSERTLVSSESRFVFDSYEAREAPAQKRAARVFALIKDLHSRRVGDVQFYDITPTVPFNYPDPRTPDLYRYQFNALIHARHVRGTS